MSTLAPRLDREAENHRQPNRLRWRATPSLALTTATASLLAGVGCSEAPTDEAAIGTVSDAIRYGTEAKPFDPGTTAPRQGKHLVDPGPAGFPTATATLINPSWLLTAKHCAFTTGQVMTSHQFGGDVTSTVDAVFNLYDRDFALVHLSTPLYGVPRAPLWTGLTEFFVGNTVSIWGYGALDVSSPTNPPANTQCPTGLYWDRGACLTLTPGKLRYARDLPVLALESPKIVIGENSDGSLALPGDSGGPTFLGPWLIGVNVHGDRMLNPTKTYAVSVPETLDVVFNTMIMADTFWRANQWGSWDTAYDDNLADVDGDGRADIVGRSGSDLRVSLSTGSRFSASQPWTTWDSAYDYQLADVNGDGRADVIGRAGSHVQVGLSTGGSCEAPAHWTDWSTPSYQLADINADGRADIIGRNGADIQIGLSNGGGFDAAKKWTTWDTDITDYQLADVNGNGKADLVGRKGTTILVAISGLSECFGTPKPWASLPTEYGYALGDVNGDGRADLITRHSTTSNIQVAASTGSSFAPPVSWISWYAGYSSKFADVHGDGVMDLVGRKGDNVVVSKAMGERPFDARNRVTRAGDMDYYYASKEYESFTLTEGKYVAFGDPEKSAWLYKHLPQGTHTCNQNTMGGDPAVGVVKECHVANLTWVADEEYGSNTCPAGQFCLSPLVGTPSRPATFAYGANGKFRFATFTDTNYRKCSNTTFGGDPEFGVGKACYRVFDTGYSYAGSAAEGTVLTDLVNTPIAYGADGRYVLGTKSGSIKCSPEYFGEVPGTSEMRCYAFTGGRYLVREGRPFSLPGSGSCKVWYMSGQNGIMMTSSSCSGTCDDATFGADPDPTHGKLCYGIRY
ncbi:MAG: VCBS repeat-containing protein [Polyangiaceae bacterium]|nr:VCBS repeat-containing protein [Polyangiaceae bacterium]